MWVPFQSFSSCMFREHKERSGCPAFSVLSDPRLTFPMTPSLSSVRFMLQVYRTLTLPFLSHRFYNTVRRATGASSTYNEQHYPSTMDLQEVTHGGKSDRSQTA